MRHGGCRDEPGMTVWRELAVLRKSGSEDANAKAM
jgi:hypothetical protein